MPCRRRRGGGIAAAHYHLFRLFGQAGHRVRAFTFWPHNVTCEDSPDIVRRAPPMVLKRVVFSLVRNLYRIIDHGKTAYQTPDVAIIAMGAVRLRTAVRRFNPDIMILPDHGCPGLLLPKIPGCKTILVSHHNPLRFLDEPLLGAYSEIDARFVVGLEQKVLRRVDRVVCPSHYMRDVFEKTFDFDGPLSVIPNLVDAAYLDSIEAVDVRDKLGVPANATVIYIPSAGSKYKGARYVFEIVRRLSQRGGGELAFYLSGDVGGELRHELSGLDGNVPLLIPGRVSSEENLAHVKGCSFVVSPTLIENFSMAFLEAIILGLPVVTFDVGGNADMIADGKNGFLVPTLDLEGLIGQAERLLDKSFLDGLRKMTKVSARERFDPARWLGAWLGGD